MAHKHYLYHNIIPPDLQQYAEICKGEMSITGMNITLKISSKHANQGKMWYIIFSKSSQIVVS